MANIRENKSRLVTIPFHAAKRLAVGAETVTIPAGLQSTVKDFQLVYAPILDSTHEYIGGFGDTSITLTSTTFTTEVEKHTADTDLADGEYWINYETGRGRGKKADAGTSMTAAYYILVRQ
jgi:hypothetical protein